MKLLEQIRQIYDESQFPPARKPKVIQFPINNICNSRCQMCNIWEQKRGKEITPDELREILKDPLYSEVNSVGVNGGEPTLRKDIGEITQALIDSLPSLTAIYLITNGIVYSQVTKAIEDMGKRCLNSNAKLNVMISLDGVGKVHDAVRGRDGNFDSSVRVMEFAKESEGVGLVRGGCTIMKENVYGVEDLLDWCITNDLYTTFRVAIPHQRLYSEDFPHPTSLDIKERFHLANFFDHLRLHYDTDFSRKAFYLSLRNQLINDQPRTVGCAFKNRGVTLNSEGKLSYCAVASKHLGNALETPSSKLYWDNTDHLHEIQKTKCDDCFHDYDGTMNLEPTGQRVRKLVMNASYSNSVQAVKSVLKTTLPKKITDSLISRRRKKQQHALQQLEISSKTIHKEKIFEAASNPVKSSTLPNRVLITGWYGTETLGDKAILGGVIQMLRKAFDGEIDLASIEPYVSRETKRQMPELEISEILSLDVAKSKVLSGEYQSVIIAGGPLMSTISYCADLRDLFYNARSVGASTVIAGCGLGPLDSEDFVVEIEEIFQLATSTVLRDESSKQLAKSKFGHNANIDAVICDPAFIWLREQREKLGVKSESRSNRVILALRDWPISEYGLSLELADAQNAKSHFENQIVEFVKVYLRECGPDSVLPFCMHKFALGGDDRFFYKRLLREFPQVLSHLEIKHKSPAEDLLGFYSAKSALTMRFHSLVFAIGTSTPFRAIDYTLGGKIAGLANDLNCSDSVTSLLDFNGQAAANELLNSKKPVEFPEEVIQDSEQKLINAFQSQLNVQTIV